MSTVVKDLGAVSAYAYAVEKGYTGTEAEFAELMADYAEVGQRAEDAADSALESKTAAQTAATTATNKASEATTAAQTATTKAGEASQSASQASASAQTASTKASEASASATTASAKATEATTAAGTATTAKNDAVTAKTAAETAQGKAEDAQAAAEAVAESIPSDYSQLSADVSDVKENLSTLNTEGIVPTSEQMLSDNYSVDSVPYHFRKTASDNADREELEIVGGSVAWNQLVPNSFVTITGTGTGGIEGPFDSTDRFSLVENHKYVVLFSGTIPTGTTFRIRDVAESIAKNLTSSTIYSATQNTSGTTFLQHTVTSGTSYSINRNVFDLTAMFGTTIADHIYSLEQATAGAGVALFKSLFPKDYYAYDAGSIQSVSGLQSHNTVEFNQWDEEWEVGAYTNSGEKTSASDQIRCKNPVRVFPNTTYYFKASAGNRIVFLGSDGTKVGSALYDKQNSEITTPANARYLVFNIGSAYGNVYKNDICINISDASKNGTYEPYDGHSYALDDSLTLRGIPTLVDGKIKWDGDVYKSDGKVTRKYGIVDLGTLTWSKSGTRMLSSNGLSNAPAVTIATSTVPNARCDKYMPDKWSSTSSGNADKTFCVIGTQVIVMDSEYTDTSAFKTAMNGVMLVYELATPTTEQADPYISPQICHYDGTEEFVTTGIVPVGHNTKYPDNMRMKLDNLPWNFASLIAPTESTFTATRNYTTGALLIVNNVLYKATANIANGGNITVGTNVTATTLAEVIAALS